MIFIDTDIFVIDKLFTNDARYTINQLFLEGASEKGTSIYNLLEFCGIASFTLATTELTQLFLNFHQQYDLQVLYPKVLWLSPEDMIKHAVSKIFEKISLKTNYSDAQILTVAEEHNCSEFVTWNTKHFENRTHLPVNNPSVFLEHKSQP